LALELVKTWGSGLAPRRWTAFLFVQPRQPRVLHVFEANAVNSLEGGPAGNRAGPPRWSTEPVAVLRTGALPPSLRDGSPRVYRFFLKHDENMALSFTRLGLKGSLFGWKGGIHSLSPKDIEYRVGIGNTFHPSTLFTGLKLDFIFHLSTPFQT